MQTLEVSKKIDELGRIVLPIELRKALNLEQGDSVNLSSDGNRPHLVLKKSVSSCCCCQSIDDLKILPKEKYISEACLKRMK